MSTSDAAFDPSAVDLSTADPRQIICYLAGQGEPFEGSIGVRIVAIFVILVLSSTASLFPVVAVRSTKYKIPASIYNFARYFGAGIIIATAFIHLLDPAYSAIGPDTCVGLTGGWSSFSWPPAIALTSVMAIFLLDFVVDRYVEIKYGCRHEHGVPSVVTRVGDEHALEGGDHGVSRHSSDVASSNVQGSKTDLELLSEDSVNRTFKQQIAAFLILEFGVVVHSVIIGLNLGVVGSEFAILFPVIVFHQTFEGLGLGSRLSCIPFPKHLDWLPWALCIGYGLTTPIAIAIGLGLRTTYKPESFTADVVAGVLDSMSAGILIYTGLVELLARDFLFDPERSQDNKQLARAVSYVFVGTAVMALLGKWA
jgi:solute carrier family 39 (zinc transporter), member 1/2/3